MHSDVLEVDPEKKSAQRCRGRGNFPAIRGPVFAWFLLEHYRYSLHAHTQILKVRCSALGSGRPASILA